MVNHEKNKYKVRLLSKEIEDFVKYLGVEKNYASNTILSYERDLIKFSNFLDKKKVNDLVKEMVKEDLKTVELEQETRRFGIDG